MTYKPKQDAIKRDIAARKKHGLKIHSHVFTHKRDSRAFRPQLQSFIQDLQKAYYEGNGVKAGSSLIKFWKKEYRKMFGVKNCGVDRHDTMALPHISSHLKPKNHTTIKIKETHGAGCDIETYEKYLDKWRAKNG
jgi:hypothetical protein